MKSFSSLQKQIKQLSESDQTNLCRLNKLISSCKKCRDSAKQEEFIYDTLPLFNEIFYSSTFQDIFEYFSDVHIFCAFVSSLFVKEIRIRAIDQTSEDGSKLIADFLEDGLSDSLGLIEASTSPPFSQVPIGNLLLLTLEKLSCSASLLECMSAAGVPSTLVKCLYIFLDLPAVSNPDALKDRMHLQHKFTQLLQHVCLSSVAVEEMTSTDALRHLLSAAVDPCQSANAFWRKSSCTILTTLAQNCLTPHVVQYIHDAGCITDYVERLKQIQLPKADSIEAFISLFQILSESSSTTSQLLDDFHAAGGYNIITDYLLKYELEEGEEAHFFCHRLTRLLGDLIYVGSKELRAKNSAIVEVFQLPGFRLNVPKAKGEVIRNIRAIDTLQVTFVQARSAYLCNELLERVRDLFERSPGNYFILDKHNLISSITEVIATKPDSVQGTFFDVFASLIEHLCYVPLQEISSVALLLRNCKYPTCLQYAFSCLLRLILTFPTMKEFYRNVGILEVTTQHLERCTDTMFRSPDATSGVTTSTVRKISIYDVIDQAVETPLVDLLITILRLLTAAVYQSAPDILVVSNLKGVHCVLTRLLPNLSLPPRVVKHALGLLYEVLVVSPMEDQLLGLLDVLPSANISLRIEVLRLLCNVLRDSHRCRTIFRKCNGSVRIIHQLVLLNGCLLPDDELETALGVDRKRQLTLLIKGVIAVLTIAMKFEPASAKHFVVELQFESLEQALRLLGCFNKETVIYTAPTSAGSPNCQSASFDDSTVTSNGGDSAGEISPNLDNCLLATFRLAFLKPSVLEQATKMDQFADIPTALLDVCLIFRYLIGMALDEFDRTSLDADQNVLDSEAKGSNGRLFSSPPSIVHTGAVLTILRLIPAIVQIQGYKAATLNLQYFSLELLNAVIESERSQQLLCGGGITDPGVGSMGMPRTLLVHFRPALASSQHPLHAPVATLFSLLAAQSLTPRDFRDYLRLSGQFCEHQQSPNGTCTKVLTNSESKSDNDGITAASGGGKAEDLPLLNLPALPAITDLLEQTVWRQRSGANRYSAITTANTATAATTANTTCLPAFVEFNMSMEGFGCLFLPSLAPQRIVAPVKSFGGDAGLAGASSTCAGGVGIGERAFPPANGITYCSWICVDDFGTPPLDSSVSHPVRLLTVFKGVQGTNEQLICLSIHLDPQSRSLVISSKERLLPTEGGNQRSKDIALDSPNLTGDDAHTVVFTTSSVSLWTTNVWRHVALVFARANVVRTSLCSFYLDGSLVGTQKILFAPPGSGTVTTSVCAFVGTPPCQYQPCSLRWRQGPFQLVEEPLTAGQVALIAALGPEYIGSLQAPPAPPNGQDILQPLFSEEKLSFAACGSTYVTLTITRIRRVYNPTDAALICKVLHMPLRENLTPIRVLRNLATQLAGAARSLGAVLVGYQGVRVFSPCALGTLLSAVANPTGLLLSFLALANTPAQLKNSLRAIFCVIGASHATAAEVKRLHGYQLMAGILRKKSQFLDEDVVGLVTQFTFNHFPPAPPFKAWVNLPPNSQKAQFSLNEDAFRDLLCDLKLWLRRPPQNEDETLDYALVSHLIEQIASHFTWLCNDHASVEAKASTEKLAKLVSDCLFDSLIFLIMDAVNGMNSCNPTSVHFGQLIAASMRLFGIVLLTTPTYGVLQLLGQFLIWTLPRQQTKGDGEIPNETVTSVAQERSILIFVRNQCFLLLSHLLSQPKPKCSKLCDQMVSVLGFDWFNIFLSPNLHDATAAHALRTFCLALLTFSGGEQKSSTDPEFTDFPGLVAFRKELFSGGWMRVSTKRGQMGGTATGGLPFATARLSSAYSIEAVQTRMSNNDTNGRVDGFLALSALLVNNAGMPEVYAMLIHLLLGIRTPFVPVSMFTFDELYNHLVHVISTEKSTVGLCDQTIPPPDFFLQKIPLHPLGISTGVADFSATSETVSTFASTQQTMHNSNLLDNIACPEAATIIISILSALMRTTPSTLSPSTQHMPIVILQLFSYLYQSNFGFQTVCLSPEFLTGLIDLLVISTVSQAAYGTPKLSQDEVCELSWHRLDELLLSFLRTIVVDSFSLPPTAHRPVHVVDVVLEAEHSSCSSKQQHEIQTMLMRNLMECMLAKDLLSESCLLLPSRGYAQHIPQNIAYFACRLVDKLWQGCFLGSISEIIDFITQLIQMLEQHLLTTLRSTSSPRHYPFTQSASTSPPSPADPSLALSRASLYRSLNRSVLFQLSRPVLKQRDQKLAISMLQILLSDDSPLNSFIFSSFNSADTEFPVCLAHLLIQHVQRNHQGWVNLDLQESSSAGIAVQSEMQELETPDSVLYRTAFDTEDFETDDDEEKALLGSSPPRQSQGQRQEQEVEEQEDLPAQQEEFEQLATLALKLWEHCYIWNQKVFVALLPNSPLSQLAGIPSLLEWSAVLEGPCIMKWTTYVDAEATGCGGIVSQNAATTPTSQWGLLSMYGPSTIERQLESTNNKVTGADQPSSTPPKPPIKGFSHQLSKKLGRMSASVLRMASNSAVGSGGGGAPTMVGEVSSARSVESRRSGRQFSLVESVDVSGSMTTGSTSGSGDADWVLVPRVPIGLPLLTKKSTTLSTLKRISMQVESPLTLVTESLEWSKQSQERDTSFLWREVEIEWNKMEDNLTQERSIWGPMCADEDVVKWELDPTEGPCRMRKRMLPNPNFYRHYPTISRTTHAVNEEVNASSANEESGSTQTPATTRKRSYIAPQSLGARFRYRRRRLLRGPEAPKKVEEQEAAVAEAPPSDTIDHSGENLTFSDIAESEDTLIRTSRLLRDSKNNASRSVSFVDSSSEALCDTPGNSVEAESVEEGGGEECGEAIENSSTESLDLGLDDQAAQRQPPLTPLQPQNSQHHQSSTDGASRQSLPSKTASSSASEGSSTALDQLNGHIAFMRLLEPVECLSAIYRCARICGLDVHEGLLLFGRNHFYVIDGYTLTNTHEIVSIEALPPGMQHKPIVPTGSDTVAAAAITRRQAHSSSTYASDLVSSGAVDQISGNQYFKFAYDKIREVHRRRYLLQQTALEVFNADGRNFFLVFAKDFQSKVYECFTAASSVINTNRFASLHSARTNSHLLSSLLGEKTVTQRWVRGDISNFQYLMYLNTQAGRSYNDLMQYPVFPWVLADYTSLHLDLSRPTTFRDFTKPMGAQTLGRLAQFQRRFREWEDPSGETPPYHYGTHYSSAMIVASYLVRMEPFAQHFIKLQGGHFDLPDRMFHSVEEAWLSASQHNMADVRELIPEFFYLPDFLVNSNHFDFGCKQSGIRVDNVLLPPWAKGDPREFIRQHREALESEYVSANLHHWIDLIFGYKQRGEPAVQAVNVFHHLFYEGNVDIYAIDDPVKRRAVVGFINNFGQIPRQIFRKPHPAKKMVAFPPLSHPTILIPAGSGNGVGSLPDSRTNIPPASSAFFFHNLESLKPSLGAVRELRHAVGQILQLEPGNLKGFSFSSGSGLSSASQFASGGLSTLILPPSGLFGIGGGGAVSGGGNGGGSGSSGDSSGSSGVAAGPIVVVEQNMVLLPPNFTRYLAWGYPDDSFRICSLLGDKVLQVFEMVNSSQVLCAAAPNASTIVTAGMSGVVKVWQLRSPNEEQGKPFCPSDWNVSVEGHGPGVVFGTTASSLQLTGCLYGHTDVVTCLAASDSFNLIVSGGRDCTCIVWDLRYLIFLRQLGTSSGGTAYKAPVAAVCISEATGDIAVCAGAWLYLWSITGDLVACLNTAPDQSNQIYCVAMSTLRDWDPGHVVVTGGSDGFVRMWGLDYVCEESPDSTTSKIPCPSLTSSNDYAAQMKWRRQLTLRAHLTVHTAFDRSDTAPLPLMALAISRDHRSVLVGDAKGRVFAWSVPGGGSGGIGSDAISATTTGAQFSEDGSVGVCAAPACGTRFSLTERKHHCRNCGKAFCSRCSRFESEIHPLRIFRPVRVCTDCYALLAEQQGPTGP
ncbi:WD repeat and FYVE domain-containing protein 3 [Echinococcus granulosus]|nr:WD repeat and FYVE domain-containing protein 3 [Echinococcus granulosus]